MSKGLDMGNLPNLQGNKKQKFDSLTSSITLVVVLDPVAPVANPTVSKVEDSLPRLGAELSKPSPIGLLDSGPMTLLRSEGLACDKFK